jgi:hypothetical protein
MEVGVKVLIGVLRLETAKRRAGEYEEAVSAIDYNLAQTMWNTLHDYTLGEPTWNELPGMSTHGRFGSAHRGPWSLVRQFPTTKGKPRRVRPGFFAQSASSWQCRRRFRSAGSCHLAPRLAGSACHLTSSLAGSACRLANSACRLASRLASSARHLTSSLAGSACRLARSASCRRHSFPPIRY